MYMIFVYCVVVGGEGETERSHRKNDTALIQHMFQGSNIDVNANIAPVCMYW